jgi:hypothetical protein
VDEIGQEPRHDLRLPTGPRRWLTGVGVILLVAAVAAYGVGRLGGRHGAGAAGAPSATASSPVAPLAGPALVNLQPRQAPAAAAGTVLLTCGSVVFSNYPGWQAGSLRLGPLWLVGGRSLGFVRVGRATSAASAPSGQLPTAKAVVSVVVEMLVHVDPGATVVMRAAAGAWPAFGFLNSPAGTGSFQELDGGLGYTFIPCPAADTGYGTGFYQVGFSISPGQRASVEVWTSPLARPVWLTFAAPVKAP